jgi:MFS-type transporter involved in bile tolerance (Atg22 family)
VPHAHPPRPASHEIERSLASSRHEGVTAQVALGILDYYLIPFALFLGASTQQIGLLVALPSLFAAVSQFFVVDIVKFLGDRRRLLITGAVLQTLFLFPFPALAEIPFPGRIATLFALIVVFRIVGAVMGPAWGSLVSDHLPARRRGDYFGRRSQAVGICGIISVCCVGVLLHFSKAVSAAAAFVAVFVAASLSRLWSCRYMARMINLPEHHLPREDFSWQAVKRRLRNSHFARFVGYISAVTFAAQLTSAYFSVHMLRDLHFDYVRYTAVQLASATTAFLTFPLWGRHADMLGNERLLKFNSLLLPFVPILWCLGEHAWYLFLVELFDGFVWAGFNLCSANFVYDAVPPYKRVRALGYYNLGNGAAICLGALLGGWLADRLPPLLGYRLHTLFLLAAGARLAADFLLARHFREVREVRHAASSADLFFSVVGIRPLTGANVEVDPPAPHPVDAEGHEAF